MAEYNGKKGRWITTEGGRHLFIEGAEEPINKKSGKKKVKAEKVDRTDALAKRRAEKRTNAILSKYPLFKDGREPDDVTAKGLNDALYKFYSENNGSAVGHTIEDKDGALYIDGNEVFKFDTSTAQEQPVKEPENTAKESNKPEGEPIETYPTQYDAKTSTSMSFDKYGNGYFAREVKFDKDGNVVSDTNSRISKEEYETARGADHKKMSESDFSATIADVRKMPETDLADIEKKTTAYIELINAMKKSGYQGSEDKDYNDVIKEFATLSVLEYNKKKGDK